MQATATTDAAEMALAVANRRNQGVTWNMLAREFGLTLRAAQEAVAWAESGALGDAPELARAKPSGPPKRKTDPKAKQREYRQRYAAIRRGRLAAKREREAEAEAADIEARQFKPWNVIILWPAGGTLTPSSRCNHGPIKRGSREFCPICYQSGWDGSRHLRRDPRTDPRPEPVIPDEPDEPETRRDRRHREWVEARNRAIGRGKPAVVA